MRAPQVVLVSGLARSGTTWLAKILDSHPDTRYIHEPDDLPEFRDYLARVLSRGRSGDDADLRELATLLSSFNRVNQADSWPIFRKHPEALIHHRIRQAGGLALRVISGRLGNFRIPPMLASNGRPQSVIWKSVNLSTVLPELMSCWKTMHVLFLMRHPGAVIASRRRGVGLGQMAPLTLLYLQQVFEEGKSCYPDAAQNVDPDSDVDLEAFRWAYLCSKCAEACEGDERAKVVRYEDLVASPAEVVQGVMLAMGLRWDDAQRHFLDKSTASSSGGFYSLNRAPLDTQNWRREIGSADLESIRAIVQDTPAGRYYEWERDT